MIRFPLRRLERKKGCRIVKMGRIFDALSIILEQRGNRHRAVSVYTSGRLTETESWLNRERRKENLKLKQPIKARRSTFFLALFLDEAALLIYSARDSSPTYSLAVLGQFIFGSMPLHLACFYFVVEHFDKKQFCCSRLVELLTANQMFWHEM